MEKRSKPVNSEMDAKEGEGGLAGLKLKTTGQDLLETLLTGPCGRHFLPNLGRVERDRHRDSKKGGGQRGGKRICFITMHRNNRDPSARTRRGKSVREVGDPET